MKHIKLTILLTILMSMVGAKAFAYNAIVDGICYNFSGTNAEVTYYSSYDDVRGNPSFYWGDIVIPESVTYRGTSYRVTSIGFKAFVYCSSLTSITIPSSVTSIGSQAFYHCSKLTSVNIPNSVTSIGSGAFSGCSGLTSVIIPNSVTSIGEGAFDNTAWYNNQPDGLVYAGKVAYMYKGTMPANTTISIKNGTLGISVGTFYDCTGLTSINIPNSVKSIGYGAFYGCSGLTSITIPNSMTSIGGSVFYGCSGLTSVTIPNSVTSIGGSAFSGCYSLTSITIPNSVTSISNSAFENCSGLTSVTLNSNSIVSKEYTSSSNFCTIFGSQVDEYIIGNEVTSIGVEAFSGCSGLTSISIPNSVTSIGDGAFLGCSGLTKVIISDIASWCGITFSYYESNPLYYAHHLYRDETTEITDLVIPDGVTSIGNGAFGGCTGLTSVTIPNNVTSIGGGAFYNCSGFISVTIPSSVTSIGGSAFSGCSGLTSINIPENVTRIGEYAFHNTAWYNNQHDGLVYAGKVAYSYKGTMPANTSISIVDGTLGIAGGAFSGCSALTSITIPNSVTSIGGSVFYGCSGLTSITIPNSVTTIGSSAFGVCTGLTSITIPNSVTSIGSMAFYACTKLSSVTIGNSVTSIGYGAFAYCSALTSVTIPNSVTSIGNRAFADCSGLTSITIPNSVTKIGDEAFSNCSKLTSVTVLNPTLVAISQDVFTNRKNATLYVPNGSKSVYNAAAYWKEFKEIVEIIPVEVDGLYYYLDKASNQARMMSKPSEKYTGSITIPSSIIYNDTNYSVTSIGDYTFSDCYGLTSITIPNSVTSIGESAFYSCTGLTSVTIPNSVTKIGDEAFSGTCLTSVILNSNAIVSKEYIKSIFGAQVKEYVLGDEVTSIGSQAFSGCSGLTSVTIGSSVTSIGDGAFLGCSNLNSIIVNAGNTNFDSRNNCNAIIETASNTLVSGCKTTIIPNSVTSIGKNAFRECYGLTSVTIPNSVTSIGDYAFNYCSGLTSVTIPNGVTSIGNYAFYDCDGLTSIAIPNSVTSIGGSAFWGCSGLTSVTLNSNDIVSKAYTYSKSIKSIFGDQVKEYVIGDNVTEVGDYAFFGCSGLTSATIGNSVTSIGSCAFSSCSGLISVTIGNNVTNIGNYAFAACSGLTSVTALNPTPVAIFQGVFSNRANATLYVPKGSKSAYKAADYWKEFKEIVEIDIDIDINAQFNLTYIIDGEEYRTYKLKVGEVITPEPDPIKEGYTFSGWSEIPSTMPYHDVTIMGYFRKNGISVYKSLDDYIANSVTSLSNNSYYISPTINNVERVYVDLSKSTSYELYCYLGIKNKVNTKMIDFSSKNLQSTSSDNLVVYEGSNSIRRSIKDLANNNTYPWLYYNPENTNEVIIDVKLYFGCTGYIEKWQKNFGTSCVVNIETENAETSIHDIRDSSIKDDRYYNLQGQRVISPKKGIYIINGKKVIIK